MSGRLATADREEPSNAATPVIAGPLDRPAPDHAPCGQPASVVLPGGTSLSSEDSSVGRLLYFRSVAQIGRQAARGLEHAHARRIVHRDIKPSNLLLDTDGVVWITDFGLAKSEEDNLTRTGDIVGTIRYMAPERFRGGGDARADVYALGLTMYELLTLQPAFGSFNRLELVERIMAVNPPRPRAIDPRIPRDLETIVLKAIDKDPRQRYQTAGDVADELRRFLDGEPIRARRVGEVEMLWKWSRRRPAVATLSATLLFLLAALLGLGAWSYVLIGEALSAARDDRRQAVQLSRREAAARSRAERDRSEALSEAFHALLIETRALRLAREAGWRDDAQENLRRLATMPTERKDLARLRSEAAACLAEMDARRLLLIRPHSMIAWQVAFSPDGRTLAFNNSGGREGLIWDLVGDRPAGKIPLASGYAPLGFHPGEAYLAYGAPGDRVELLPLSVRAPALPPLLGPGPAVALSFDGPGRRLAVAWGATRADGIPSGMSRVDVVEVASGRLLRTIDGPFETPVYKVPLALSPDGLKVAIAGPGHTIQAYGVDHPGPPVALGSHRATVNAPELQPGWGVSRLRRPGARHDRQGLGFGAGGASTCPFTAIRRRSGGLISAPTGHCSPPWRTTRPCGCGTSGPGGSG